MKKIRCRLFGHDVVVSRVSGGIPDALFHMEARCRRCGEDQSLTVPSRLIIKPSTGIDLEES